MTFTLQAARGYWDACAREDPIKYILTDQPYSFREYFETGRRQVQATFDHWVELGIKYPQDGLALDFGCGMGRLTSALEERGYGATGVDVSREMILKAIEHRQRPCSFHHSQHPDLRDFADSMFSIVYSLITLQHMPWTYQRDYIREFLRVCKPDGLVYFGLPEGPADLPYVSALTMYGQDQHEVVCHIEDCGATVLDAQYAEDSMPWRAYRYTVRP
jgi:ubiquinone/menaquinone biosynthesis C-methylase UbiE